MKIKAITISGLLVLLVLSACVPTGMTEKELTVMTHDSFSISEDLVRAFEHENDVRLVFLKAGNTGAAINRAILTKKTPQADVFYGIDNTFLSRAIEEEIFESYKSPLLSQVAEEFKVGISDLVTPIDFGDVCLNYDVAYFSSNGLSIPTSLADLLKPEYGKGNGREGLLVVENPTTSSTGLAFLLSTIAEFGEDGYLKFWQALRENGTVVVNDWETAYYTNFSASSGKGLQPLVVSYASSPAAEVIYASTPITEAPTAAITTPNTCFRQIEYAGILKGTRNKSLAKRFIDFMLDTRFQQDMPLQMFVYPVNSSANIPAEFTQYAQSAAEPAFVDPELIAAKRDEWIREWTKVMLR